MSQVPRGFQGAPAGGLRGVSKNLKGISEGLRPQRVPGGLRSASRGPKRFQRVSSGTIVPPISGTFKGVSKTFQGAPGGRRGSSAIGRDFPMIMNK